MSEYKWLECYLYFIARKYPFVLVDLLESYVLNKRDIDIMIDRYVNQMSIRDISKKFNLSENRIEKIKVKVLSVLLNTRLN